MNTLFKISDDYINILRELEDNGGELTPELDELLKINEGQLEQKCLAYDSIIKLLQTQEELANKEIERINKFKEIKVKQIEKLEANLLQALLLFGKEDKLSPKEQEAGKIPVKRLEFGTLRLSTRRSVSTVIENESVIDDKYKYSKLIVTKLSVEKLNKLLELIRKETNTHENIITDTEASKTLIKVDLEKKIEVEGAKLVTNYSLTIK